MQNNWEGVTNTYFKFHKALRELINSLLGIILSKDFVLLRVCSKNFFKLFPFKLDPWGSSELCKNLVTSVDQRRIEAYRSGGLIMEEAGF